MCNENDMENANKYEAAEAHAPAAFASEIINKENSMSKIWPFVGGVLVGAAGVVAAALVADKLEYREGGLRKKHTQETATLALPEGRNFST